MKSIIELREEAIKKDKNPEFYLYQKLEKIICECLKLEKELKKERKKFDELNKNTNCVEYNIQFLVEMLKTDYAYTKILDLKEKLNEILEGE